MHKYTSGPPRQFFATFIDFSSAFETINRKLLWGKLARTNIAKRLLLLILELHTNTTMKIRISTDGRMTKGIQTKVSDQVVR